MHTKVVFQAAKALTRIGCAVLRFNFRGVGRSAGAWDEGRGEKDDYRAALDYFAGRHPGVELWAAGFSFGSYIAMTCGADDDRVCTLIGIAPPVDTLRLPAASSSRPSRSSSFTVRRDELIPLRAVREFYARFRSRRNWSRSTAPHHLFEGQASEVGDALEDLLADFTCKTQ